MGNRNELIQSSFDVWGKSTIKAHIVAHVCDAVIEFWCFISRLGVNFSLFFKSNGTKIEHLRI